jgi:hypothetical protein
VADDDGYDRVRDIPAMRRLIGARLDDVSCTDKGEHPTEIYLLFSNGTVLTVTLTDEPGTFAFEELTDDDDD